MKPGILNRCINILYRDWAGNKHRPSYHFAFAIKKNKILAVGRNKPDHESNKALQLGRLYGIEKWNTYPFLHAESDLITRLDPEYQNHKTEILSLRINRHGRFKLAKPCVNCQKMLDEIGITKVVWSCNLEDEVPNDLILGSQHKIMLERVIKRKINLSVTQEGWEAGVHKF